MHSCLQIGCPSRREPSFSSVACSSLPHPFPAALYSQFSLAVHPLRAGDGWYSSHSGAASHSPLCVRGRVYPCFGGARRGFSLQSRLHFCFLSAQCWAVTADQVLAGRCIAERLVWRSGMACLRSCVAESVACQGTSIGCLRALLRRSAARFFQGETASGFRQAPEFRS